MCISAAAVVTCLGWETLRPWAAEGPCCEKAPPEQVEAGVHRSSLGASTPPPQGQLCATLNLNVSPGMPGDSARWPAFHLALGRERALDTNKANEVAQPDDTGLCFPATARGKDEHASRPPAVGRPSLLLSSLPSTVDHLTGYSQLQGPQPRGENHGQGNYS